MNVAEAVPSPSPTIPPAWRTSRLKAAEAALEAARDAQLAAKGRHATELLALRGATAAVKSASAALEACAGPADRSFGQLVRDLNQAQAALEACGDRVERAERVADSAAATTLEAERELTRATVESIDLGIGRENFRILGALVAAAKDHVEAVNELKRLAAMANSLEATLPGYQPPWDGQPSHRNAALVQAGLHVYAPTTAGTILTESAAYAAGTGA